MDTSIQNANDKEVTDLKDADDVRVAADLKVTNTHNFTDASDMFTEIFTRKDFVAIHTT